MWSQLAFTFCIVAFYESISGESQIFENKNENLTDETMENEYASRREAHSVKTTDLASPLKREALRDLANLVSYLLIQWTVRSFRFYLLFWIFIIYVKVFSVWQLNDRYIFESAWRITVRSNCHFIIRIERSRTILLCIFFGNIFIIL